VEREARTAKRAVRTQERAAGSPKRTVCTAVREARSAK